MPYNGLRTSTYSYAPRFYCKKCFCLAATIFHGEIYREFIFQYSLAIFPNPDMYITV